MEFIEITEKEYDYFWDEYPYKSFLSSSKIGKLREINGWNVTYLGVKDDNRIISATMLVSIKRLFNKYEFYAPRGVLTDYNNMELLTFFIKNIRRYIKEHKGFIFRIDPYILLKERDIDGNIKEDGFDNTKIVDNLLYLGFKKSENSEQVTWMFSLTTKNKSEDEIFKEMRNNTRNIIRKSEKYGITIDELELDNLKEFYDILDATANRRHFSARNISYYQNIYKILKPSNEIKFLVTHLNLNQYIDGLKANIKEKEDALNKLSDSSFNDGKRKTYQENIDNLNKRIEQALTMIKENNNNEVITLSGSMFIMMQPEVIYLSSGNYDKYLYFNSQYLIQWEMIKYAIKNNFKKYNFYGIPANINKHPKDYGIYEFKKGFNGYVEELIGEYELAISKEYYLYKLLHCIKKIIKK